MASPFDTLLQQVKNKLSSATQFIKSNPTPNAYLSQQFQQNVAQPVAQKIANTPVMPFLNVTPKSYIQGQVINPIKQGVQQIQQPGLLNKGLGAMQLFGGASAITPYGALSNIAQGAIGGVGQSIRERKNPLTTISQGINNPTSVATTGLGITNPYMALAVDVMSPSVANKGVKIAQAKGLINVPGLSKTEGALADSKGFFDNLASTFQSGVSGSDRKKAIAELAQEAKRHASIFEMSPKEIERSVMASPEAWVKKLQEKATLFLADRARATSYGLKTNLYGGKSATGFKNEGSFSSMADKKVRFEIDDSGAKLKPFDEVLKAKSVPTGKVSVTKLRNEYQKIYSVNPFDRRLGEILKQIEGANSGVVTSTKPVVFLQDVLDHPNLYKEYPSLRGIVVEKKNLNGSNAQITKNASGQFVVQVDSKLTNNSDIKSTILHEIQHAIQEKEGFARGGSPGTAIQTKMTFGELKNTPEFNNEANKLGQLVQQGKITSETAQLRMKAWIDMKLSGSDAVIDPMQAYQRLSGEVEARDVQSRMNLTPEQRASTLPYQSQNIPVKDQIVRFEGGVSASKPSTGGEKGGTTVYHGTNRTFDKFDINKSGSNQGLDEGVIFFTSDKNRAKTFSADYPQKPKYRWNEADKQMAQRAEQMVKEANINTKDSLTLQDVLDLYKQGKIKTKPVTDKLFRAESAFDNNRQAIKEAVKITGKKVFKFTAEGETQYAVFDTSLIKPSSGDIPKVPSTGGEIGGIKVYRGGNQIKEENITNSGISFSSGKNVAQDFAKNKGGVVNEYTISPQAKIANYSDIPGVKYKNLNDYSPELDKGDKQIWRDLEVEYQKAINWAKNNGYDAIKLPLEGEIRVINPKVISSSGEIPKGVSGGKAQFKQPIKVPEQPRGFTESVQQAGNIPKRVKGMVQTVYTSKPNTKLMGEAQALLQEGASLDITKVQNVDQKIAATIQEAINQQRKNPELAANLYNNLARQGTELGRGVQAYSLLQKMTPEAIAKSAAGKIQEYNRTAVRKIPELTGDQLKLITARVDAIKKLPIGSRERNIAVNELSNTVNNFIPSSIADKAITVWKAGLLTSLRTTERNIFGNTVHGAIEAIKDLPATAADMLMSMATGKRTITPTLRGVSEAWSKKTAQQISDTIKLGYDATEDISKYDIKRVNWGNTPIQQALKKYTDIVFRSLGAQDKPFYNAAFKRSLFSQAGAEAINVGRGGDRSFIQHLVNNPTEDMVKLAMSDANVATFKDKNMASAIASKIKRALEEGVTIGDKKYQSEILRVASDVFLPFTGVPSSIFGQIANYSPVGLLKGIVNTGKVLSSQVPDLQRQAAQEIGRGVIGTGIYGLGAYLASKGLITGQPKDAEEQRQWDLENKPRNSIMIGGKWRSLNSIGPEAVVFLAGAKLNEEMKNPEGSVGGYAGTLAKDYLDQSFVQGLQQPVNVITDPTRYGKSYAGNMIASFVPNIVKDYAKSQDPYQRETNTIGDYAKAAIPGLRNTLIEKRDVLGNVMKQEPTGLGAFFDLFNSKTPVDNAVVSELSRLQKEGEGATPSKLTPQQTILKQKVKLTFEQLNQLEQGVGEIVRPRLETLIQSPVYQQLDDEHKAKAIDSIVNDARLKYKNINAKTLTGAGLNPNQYLDVNGNLKTVSTEPIPEPKLTGNKVIDDKLKASYKTAVQNQQMEQYKLATQTTPTLEKKTYDYIDENGNYKTVDLTPVKFPEMTGNTVIDKKLISAYNSQINAQINDVIKLNQAGQITQKEMINMVNSLNAQYKKNKSIGGLKPRLKIRKLPKLKALKVKKAKKIKVPKLARINIKPLKGV